MNNESINTDDLKRCASEALTALETYNIYDIKTDRYAHSTDLIYELRNVVSHKRQPLRESKQIKLFRQIST